jgi:membrane fusion protein (multidrug efflux system)
MIKYLSNSNRISLMMVAGIVLAITQLSACGGDQPAPPPPAPPKVVTTPVLQQTIPITMRFPGTVREFKKVLIKPRVSGYIGQHQFIEGSLVKSGDLLYQIDPQPLQAALDAANAQLEQDQATLNFWNTELKRYDELVKKGSISKERRDTAATREKEYAAAVSKANADVEQAQLNLGYARITAPFDGWIEKTEVHKGAVVTAQVTELATLIALNPIYVDFSISRNDAYIIQQLSAKGLGPKQRTDISGTVTLPDGTMYGEKGHIDYISSTFNANTDTMAARVVFPNDLPEHADNSQMMLALIPGQYVPLSLTVGHRPDALLIPQSALQETQQGSFVYVVDKDNTVKQQMVEKGVAYEHYWVIEKGLQKGDMVVSQGLQKIRKAGMEVEPVKAGDNNAPKETDS